MAAVSIVREREDLAVSKSIEESAKDVIRDILAASGGELFTKVVLYKAFYCAHLYYLQATTNYLTAYPIVRLPEGPGIYDGPRLLSDLEKEGRISIERRDYGPYPEYAFALRSPRSIDVSDPRYRAVERAVKWLDGKSASELSEETHLYSRTWNLARDGEELPIILDLVEDEEFARMSTIIRNTEELFADAFS